MWSHERCRPTANRLSLLHDLGERGGRVSLARYHFEHTYILDATNGFTPKPVIRQRVQIGQSIAFASAITVAQELQIFDTYTVAIISDMDAKLS